MGMNDTEIVPVQEHMVVARMELDQAVATAKAYPRNVRECLTYALVEATTSPDMAAKCYYTLPGFKTRDGGTTGPIMGTSVRLTEIVQRHWGNLRAGGRCKEIDKELSTVTVQCFVRDLENNFGLEDEYTRRFYGPSDGSGPIVAIQAAKAISIRNLIIAIVGRAAIDEIFEHCKDTVADSGDAQEAFDKALDYFDERGVTEDELLRFLELESRADVNNKSMVQLRGLVTALKDNHMTIEQVFRQNEERVEIDINEASAKEIEPELPSAETAVQPSREETDG